MSESILPAERKMFVIAMKDSFNKDDSKTIELIVKNIKEMGLTSIEIADVGRSLCRLKSRDNWNEIKVAMSSIEIDFEKNCLPQQAK